MSHLDQLGTEFALKDDWTGYYFRDFRIALENALLTTQPAVSPGDDLSQYNFIIDWCKSSTDYALYSFGGVNFPFIDRDDWSIDDFLKEIDMYQLYKDSKRNLLTAYIFVYLYKYIKEVEIKRLQGIIERHPHFSTSLNVDFFITQMLFAETLADYSSMNSGAGITYSDIVDADVPQSRKEALQEISASIVEALELSDERALFENIFMLMTYFVGSPYRRVHHAVVALLNIDMGTFRQFFYEHLDGVIKQKGGIRIIASDSKINQ